MREQAVQLGSERHLVGVLSRPATDGGAAARPAVLVLNAGVLHRVGPHRLHVTLARRLAERGCLALRIDLSGIGDSRAVPGSLSFRDSSVADARAAMDWLAAETGAQRFVIFGLCSGADNALATAAADPRVTGIVVIDPPAYATPRARLRRITDRMRDLGGAREVLRWGVSAVERRVRHQLARRAAAPSTEPDEPEIVGGREVPPVAVYRSQLRALVDRGVAIFAIFSGALGERYNHEDQLFELFPELRGKVDRAYFPDANHMFTERAAQAALVAAVTAWIERRR